MSGKIVHKETEITITHDICVDSCIADEIRDLNNKNGIFTLSSCCGHGHSGYIIVAGNYIKDMLKLGYDVTVLRYLDNDIIIDEKITMCAFRPKSKCNCDKDSK